MAAIWNFKNKYYTNDNNNKNEQEILINCPVSSMNTDFYYSKHLSFQVWDKSCASERAIGYTVVEKHEWIFDSATLSCASASNGLVFFDAKFDFNETFKHFHPK